MCLSHSAYFLYNILGPPFGGTYDFKMYTPANAGSYGIPTGLDAFDEVVFFAVSQ